MSKISGKETKLEIMVRKYLFSQGFRYLKNDKRYPGKPDIVLPKYKTIIFINGCFWHGHTCKAGRQPETRKEFWIKKIGDTVIRDKNNQMKLQRLNWKVIVVWECELKNNYDQLRRLNKLMKEIRN